MAFPVFKTKEEIPKGFESEYEEKDGEWHPNVDDGAEAKTALADERKKREAAEKLVTKTANELTKLKTEGKARESGLTEEQLEKIRSDVRKDLEEEYKPFKDKAESASTENRTLKLDNAVKAQMGSEKVKVRGERQSALWKLISDRFDLTEDGKPMVKANPGVTVEKYLAETVKLEFPEFYVGNNASGGGANQQARGAAQGAITSDQILANPSAALQASRAAGKTE